MANWDWVSAKTVQHHQRHLLLALPSLGGISHCSGKCVFLFCCSPSPKASTYPAADLASLTSALDRHHLKKPLRVSLQRESRSVHSRSADRVAPRGEGSLVNRVVGQFGFQCQALVSSTLWRSSLSWSRICGMSQFIVLPSEVAQLPRHGPRHVETEASPRLTKFSVRFRH